MAMDVQVHIPKLGAPDLSLTASQLGGHSRPPGYSGRPCDVWELVRLFNGRASLKPQDYVGQIGGCNFVKDLSIRVDLDLEYYVAKELQDNMTKANNAGDKALANFYHWLLNRVKWHAGEHYEQFVMVIMTWEGDIENDLAKTLPTDQKPTSLKELDIMNGVGALVSDWIVELDYRLKRAAYDWEQSDYPQIDAQMRSQKLAPVFIPTKMAFSLPPLPQSPASRRKIAFPPCRP